MNSGPRGKVNHMSEKFRQEIKTLQKTNDNVKNEKIQQNKNIADNITR